MTEEISLSAEVAERLILKPGPQHELRLPNSANLLEFWCEEKLVAFFDAEGNYHCSDQPGVVRVLQEVGRGLRKAEELRRQIALEEMKLKYPWLYK